MATPSVNKLVLAVHGIGDQTRNSTILSTAAQFAQNFGYRALLPLGGFYDSLQNGQPPFVSAGMCRSVYSTISSSSSVSWKRSLNILTSQATISYGAPTGTPSSGFGKKDSKATTFQGDRLSVVVSGT